MFIQRLHILHFGWWRMMRLNTHLNTCQSSPPAQLTFGTDRRCLCPQIHVNKLVLPSRIWRLCGRMTFPKPAMHEPPVHSADPWLLTTSDAGWLGQLSRPGFRAAFKKTKWPQKSNHPRSAFCENIGGLWYISYRHAINLLRLDELINRDIEHKTCWPSGDVLCALPRWTFWFVCHFRFRF